MVEFQKRVQEVLDSLVLLVESFDAEGVLECDSYGGVVRIANEEHVYLVNVHNASKQILVASPISGSVRFSYDCGSGVWCSESGQELLSFVKTELHNVFFVSSSEL